MIHRSTLRRSGSAVAVGVLAFAIVGGGTATAARLITGENIQDGTIEVLDLSEDAVDELQVPGPQGKTGPAGETGPQGPKGDTGAPGLTGLESDGPYPGATVLQDGDNSTSYWVNDGTLQRSWVMCAPGKVALGGGFTAASDASKDDKLATTIVTSQPTQIEDGAEVYHPIDGDVDGSFVPNAWLVEGYYTGSNPMLVVRPHVVCADITR